MSRIGEFTIIELLKELIGNIEPQGDTALDDKVRFNLEKWAYVTGYMVEKLAEVANCDTNGLGSVEKLKSIAEKEIGELSDGYHTFGSLYHQRMMLFAALVNQNKSHSWKTKRHEDGELCFGGGWFLVTIDTPAGAYGYHYENKYWRMFECEEIQKAKPFDGYTEKDVGRLMSIAEWSENVPGL